jgi:hypothetical protein
MSREDADTFTTQRFKIPTWLRWRSSMSDKSSPEVRSDEALARENRADSPAEELPMHLLAAGIPLTLLLDLAENFGPPSTQILEAEHDPAYDDPSDPAVNWLAHLSPRASSMEQGTQLRA